MCESQVFKERRKDCLLSYNFQVCEGTATTDHPVHYCIPGIDFCDEVQGIGKRWIFISSLGRLSIVPKQNCPEHTKII